MVGTTILHYDVLREIGSGGMGRVYLARDRRTERLVALKFLEGGTAEDSEAHDRLVREARASARLVHSGVVTLFGLEEAEGRAFLVEEFVDGESLAARLARGPLGTLEAQRLAREVTGALAHAHRRGILHRDLKPANILIAADGSYKIADFGIARVEGTPALTRTGALLGTMGYLAPERLRGHAGDARADLFALGAVLYEAVAGRPAFPGTSQAEVLHALMSEEPRPLDVPPALEPLAGVIRRMLAKEPRDRPASAEEVATILAGSVAPAGSPRSARRRAAWIAGAVAAAIAVAALAAFLVWRGSGSARAAMGPAIAVLYFENVADPEDRARMGSISSNLLVTSFAQNAELNVLGTQRVLEAMRDVGARGPIDRAQAMRVARRAHAQRIVTGSILRIEPGIVLTAEVADVASGRVIHAERIEGEPGQTVFDVVDLLSLRLTPKLARHGEAIPGPASPVARVTSANLEAQAAYAEALEHFAAGELYAASAGFGAALARDPTFPQALYHEALVQWWLNEAPGAEASVEAARAQAGRLSPRERAVLEGVSHLVARRWTQADKVFERLARDAPDEKLAYYGLLESRFHAGDHAGAVAAARRARTLDPGFDLVAIHLVQSLAQLGQGAEADREAVQSLRRHPANAHLWLELFNLRLTRGDAMGALAAARGAHAAHADSTDIAVLGILLALNLGRVQDVEAWVNPGTSPAELVPGDGRRGLEYARALWAGRFHDAVEIAERAWRSFPADASLAFPAIPFAEGTEAAIEAGEANRALEFTDSSSARFLRWRGPRGLDESRIGRWATLIRVGRLGEAEAGMRTLQGKSVDSVDVRRLRFLRALILELRGDPRGAYEQLRGSFAPYWPPLSHGTHRLMRARLDLGLGRPESALATYDTVLAAPLLEPHEAARLRLYRGRVLERLGRDAEAVASYREFLALWKSADRGRPEVTEARAAVARLTAARAGRKARR